MKRKSRISGSFPNALYRFFTKEKYANDFAAGKFRVGNQVGYRSSSFDVRADQSEGVSRYSIAGNQHEGSFTNSVYVLCCSLATVDVVTSRKKFGDWAVRIHNPIELAIDLDWFLNGDGTAPGVQVVGAPVEYSKDQEVSSESDEQSLVELALRQKPNFYSSEMEFRYCLVDMSGRGIQPELVVDLGPLKYAEILKPA